MSMDTVDDLHEAEDFAGAAVHLIERAVTGGIFMDTPLEGEAKGIVAYWKTYCRPTCGWRDSDPHECGDDEECCGCPCRHGEDDDADDGEDP